MLVARVEMSVDGPLKIDPSTPTVMTTLVAGKEAGDIGALTIESATSEVAETVTVDGVGGGPGEEALVHDYLYVWVATTPQVVLICVALGLGFPICV